MHPVFVGHDAQLLGRASQFRDRGGRILDQAGAVGGVKPGTGDGARTQQRSGVLLVALHDGVDGVTATAREAARSFDTLVAALVAISDELSKAVAAARGVLGEVAEGKGTAGRVLRDPALYNSMQDAFERLGRALDEMRMLIEKWQREGLSVEF